MIMKYVLYFLAITAALILIFAGCGDSEPDYQPDVTIGNASPDSGRTAEKPANAGESDEIPSQALCPVMGGKINKAIFTDYNGKRVYFCCPPCVKAFESDPEKYMKALEEMSNQ